MPCGMVDLETQVDDAPGSREWELRTQKAPGHRPKERERAGQANSMLSPLIAHESAPHARPLTRDGTHHAREDTHDLQIFPAGGF